MGSSSAFDQLVTDCDQSNLRCQIGTSNSNESVRSQSVTLHTDDRSQHRKNLSDSLNNVEQAVPHLGTNSGMSHFKVVEFDQFKSERAAPSEQKETPGPLNCKQLRKGSRGQLRQAAFTSGFSQTFCKQISLTHIGGECL